MSLDVLFCNFCLSSRNVYNSRCRYTIFLWNLKTLSLYANCRINQNGQPTRDSNYKNNFNNYKKKIKIKHCSRKFTNLVKKMTKFTCLKNLIKSPHTIILCYQCNTMQFSSEVSGIGVENFWTSWLHKLSIHFPPSIRQCKSCFHLFCLYSYNFYKGIQISKV